MPIDLRFHIIDNDSGTGPGGVLLKLIDTARESKRPASVMQFIIRELDRLITFQHRCGGWPKVYDVEPGTVTRLNPADYGNDNLHWDDDSITSIVRALHRAAGLLLDGGKANRDAAARFHESRDRALAFARQCFDRCGGIPGQASSYGDSVQQRKHEPGGTVDLLATQNVAETARECGDAKLADDCEQVVAAARLDNGNLPRLIDMRTRKPMFVSADGEIIGSAKQAMPGYRWEIS